MDNCTSIQLKHTDPDTGSVTFEDVATVSLSSPWILDLILEKFKNDETYELDPNTDLIVTEHGIHPDAEDTMVKVFQLGELAYSCLSSKKSKYGNDSELGSTVRSKYIELTND